MMGKLGLDGFGRVAGVLALGVTGWVAPAIPALAQQPGGSAYAFVSPPSAQANRVYSVNRQTGEVSACQFERPDSSQVGVTRCFQRGEGAGLQPNGIYSLVATGFAGETGVFRVNAATGEMSICYVRDLPRSGGGSEPRILCTPPAK